MIDQASFDACAAQYDLEGAVMIKQPFDKFWIDGLVSAFEEFRNPDLEGKYGVGIAVRKNKVEITGAIGAHPFVRRWALESNAAEVVAKIMGSKTARLYNHHDVGFGKLGEVEDAASGSSSFHIDASAWGMTGEMVPSFWLALTDVGEDLGPLVVAVGSHKKLPGLFLPSVTDPTLPPPEGYLPFTELQPFLDKSNFPMKTFPTMRGDAVLLHPRVVHGSIPLKKRGYRMGFSTRWLGDDVRWASNLQTQKELDGAQGKQTAEAALVHGEAPPEAMYPIIWREGVGNLSHLPGVKDIHTLNSKAAPLAYVEHARVEPTRYTA